MEVRTFGRPLVLALLVVLLCAVAWTWWAYLDLKSRYTALDGELAEARALRGELRRLQETSAAMRADMRGLSEWLRSGAAQEKTVPDRNASADVSPSALTRVLSMLEEQNKQLAEGLKAADGRVEELKGRLTGIQAELNQAHTSLAAVQKQIAAKAAECAALETKSATLEKESRSSTAEAAKFKEQLAAANTQAATLLAAKKELEDRVKTLADRESEQGGTIAALTRQLEEAKKQAADLKTQIDELKKKLEKPAS